jgi:hypothetical protein
MHPTLDLQKGAFITIAAHDHSRIQPAREWFEAQVNQSE